MVSNDAAERFLVAPFLADLDASAREELLQVLAEHRARAGEVLLRQGEPNDRIHFLIEGAVSVLRNDADGRPEPILELHAPTAFGEVAYFQRRPQLVSVVALTDLRLLILERDAHEVLRRVDPRTSEQLATAAIRVLASHFELIDQRIADILARQPDPQTEATEWDRFRARLFGESKL
ncbi:cyclic nucleotide-binding domain-containing protein [Tautonia sociabilis]|uniref:Cyclic nucleotide-binding domain-containing protein n=1 Tax=Tautonia sociabilis TaxID=2080755 RepID=A0A432MDF0_9BACT|nr:cyclic nucleotide-binding domain-containing protein [Tautonia sociabilis]RUL82348.1 cyclic nucleotide-binding domain-containing protein [Tautonia sociabilis]